MKQRLGEHVGWVLFLRDPDGVDTLAFDESSDVVMADDRRLAEHSLATHQEHSSL
jgi:hypothetical protein